MAKFDIDVTIKELAPYVGKVEFFRMPYMTCYMGFYDNKPVFKLSENVIHILDFSDTNSFHKETQSIKTEYVISNLEGGQLQGRSVQDVFTDICLDNGIDIVVELPFLFVIHYLNFLQLFLPLLLNFPLAFLL